MNTFARLSVIDKNDIEAIRRGRGSSLHNYRSSTVWSHSRDPGGDWWEDEEEDGNLSSSDEWASSLCGLLLSEKVFLDKLSNGLRCL